MTSSRSYGIESEMCAKYFFVETVEVTTIERVCWQLVSTTAYSYGHCIRERMMFATFHVDESESERRVSGGENAKTAGYEAGSEPEPAKKRGEFPT